MLIYSILIAPLSLQKKKKNSAGPEKMLRSSNDGSSEEPYANCGGNLERCKSGREVKVELWGGRCCGEIVGVSRRVIIHITIQKGIAAKEKRLE